METFLILIAVIFVINIIWKVMKKTGANHPARRSAIINLAHHKHSIELQSNPNDSYDEKYLQEAKLEIDANKMLINEWKD